MENEEQLWQDPDWNCPSCGFVNRAVRERCRNFNCGKHVDELFPGEGVVVGCFVVAGESK